ncbi:MAG: RdgB/HAM1 family non-canonical purine NTP pyrophosphatase [Eggerthellaceae bacterium]|nr:RdgB/HAM1 family non-canonical purine NTP pyrophosphatase [Eggerthellaceae bacterium]
MRKKVVIASNNAHKIAEIKSALDFEGWEYCTLKEAGVDSEPEEDAATFEGNARIKARAAHEATGLAALADDSGLVVDALGGRPGIYSARYAGAGCSNDENNTKLLGELESVADADRTARFVCTLVFIDEAGAETVAEGTIEGFIAHGLSGRQGFGYDPLFLPCVLKGKRTLAEVAQDEKNAISHRGNALRSLREKISAQALCAEGACEETRA